MNKLYYILDNLSFPDDNWDVLEEPLAVIPPHKDAPTSKGNINAEDIVGIARNVSNCINWPELIEQYFHKTHWFNIASDNYNDIILNSNSDTLPIVALKNNQYYIENDGLHRLLIAKLYKMNNIPVIIRNYDTSNK